MINTIHVNEIDTPEAYVMKYIAKRIGLNIRPSKAQFDERTKIWTVPLKALVPSQVTLQDRPSKTFVYTFKDLGNAQLRVSDDGSYKFAQKPKALEIEDYLVEKFGDLTSKIENEILVAGQEAWGQFTYLRMWLRPLYTLIVNSLTRHMIPLNLLTVDQMAYANLLLSSGYLEKDESSGSIKKSNILTHLQQTMYGKEKKYAEFQVAEAVVGSVFATRYNEIRQNLKIYVPTAYVDTTKAYYMDAVRIGESISMREEELWLKYRTIGSKHAYGDQAFSFPTVVSEVVAGRLLNRDENENVIANNDILERVMPFRDEIIQVALEV